MAKRGRKKIVIDPEDYLNAIRKRHTMNDKDIARELKVSKTKIWRYRTDPDNAEVVKEGEAIMKEISNTEYRNITREMFKEIPIIKQWIDKLYRVSPKKRDSYVSYLYNLCNYFKVHPSNLNLDDLAEFTKEMREAYFNDDPQIRGLAYSGIREAIRSFYTKIHRISGEYLADIGISKEALKGQGKFAKQRIPKEVRERLEKTLRYFIDDEELYIEALYMDKFMYYTATRITATMQQNFRNYRYDLNKLYWMIEVLDKGEGGGAKWEKFLTGHALEDFRVYCSKKFDIPIDDLEIELPNVTDTLFPSFQDEEGIKIDRMYNLITKANREGLKKAGLSYEEFPANHIFRHTFAQDFLSASNWNYELTASLGGWVNTMILKKHYGEMGLEPKINGLRKAMGEEIIEEVRELRW